MSTIQETKQGYQPKTGQPCTCKRGVQRDNCPKCEGTGQVIDFAAIRARTRKATTIYGTCYFPTYQQALDYYAAYESRPAQAVETKIREGSIHIGKPEAKEGQRLFVRDNRWHVEETV